MLREYGDIKNKTFKAVSSSSKILVYKGMLSNYLKFREKIDSKYLKVAKTNKRKLMILPNCVVWDTKRLRFIKEQENSGLLSSLGIKTLSSQIPFVGPLLF